MSLDYMSPTRPLVGACLHRVCGRNISLPVSGLVGDIPYTVSDLSHLWYGTRGRSLAPKLTCASPSTRVPRAAVHHPLSRYTGS